MVSPSQEDFSIIDHPIEPCDLFDQSVHKLSPKQLSKQQVNQLSPTALAYLGDAVYELYIRGIYLLPPKRQHSYHQEVVAQVRAETQAEHLRSLEPYLTDVEKDVIRRGRNATSGKPKRVSATVYQQATSLETLMGYLYLTDRDRLRQLLHHLYPDR
jgi:ribonuclease-3 family protein